MLFNNLTFKNPEKFGRKFEAIISFD